MSREAGKDNSIAVRARRVLRTGAAIALSAALGVASPFPARAQEAEPGALITQDCSRGGFGEITVQFTGPFPYDVTVLTSTGERRDIGRGEPNNQHFDFTDIKYHPGMTAPEGRFYLGLRSDATAAEEARKFLMAVYSTCPQRLP